MLFCGKCRFNWLNKCEELNLLILAEYLGFLESKAFPNMYMWW